jgi:hypothetical protein
LECPTVAISQADREFFVALGGRIALRRKASRLTRMQFAKTLGVSQPTMNAFSISSLVSCLSNPFSPIRSSGFR